MSRTEGSEEVGAAAMAKAEAFGCNRAARTQEENKVLAHTPLLGVCDLDHVHCVCKAAAC
jgi:hypothetical protein